MASRRGRSALMVLMLFLGTAAACAARTLDVPGEYASIAAALVAAVAGDEVVIAPGSYSESLVVTAAITIRGSGPDCTAVLLGSANAEVSAVTVVLPAAGDVRFETLSLAAPGSADCIEVDGSPDGVVTVTNCAFHVGPESVGIAVQSGSLVVDSSVFRGPDAALQALGSSCGVLVGLGASAAIRNCDFAYFADAIQTLGGANLAVEACNIRYSTVGIAIRNQFSDSTTAQLGVNQIYGCSVGIAIAGATTFVMVEGNTISDCSRAPFRVSVGACFGADLGAPFSGTLFGAGNVVPQLELLCPDEDSGFWPAGFFE